MGDRACVSTILCLIVLMLFVLAALVLQRLYPGSIC